MKKKVLGLVLGLIGLFGFSANVNAIEAPSQIKTGTLKTISQYVNGYQANLKTNAAGDRFLFCEVANLKFPSNKTLSLGSEVDKGVVYILQNRPWTGDTNKDYYIMQMATWWYRDILIGGNSNLSYNFKSYCTDNRYSNSTCSTIYNLVEGARNYYQERGTLSFSSSNVTFTESGSYYVSNQISLTSTSLTSLKDLKLKDAPYGTTIINSSVSSYNKNGTFQVRIPMSSISAGSTVNFSVEIEGTYGTQSAYDYYYSSAYQRVIYDVIYNVSHPIYASKSIRFTRETQYKPVRTEANYNYNSLTIYKVDQYDNYVKGAELTLYSGDCVNSNCYSKDVYASWTSGKVAKVLYDLPTGYYTIAETLAPVGYRTADKERIYVRRSDTNYEHKVVNVRENESKTVKISKTDITGNEEISGATLVLKNAYGTVVETWVSGTTARYFSLAEGEYSLTEKYAPAGYKLNTSTIVFRVDNEGNVYAKNDYGNYVLVNYVRMVNEVSDTVSISKLDKNTNNFLAGATLEIKNEKGEVVSTWVTTNESYNISLTPGDYSITETNTPIGYIQNTNIVYFRVLEDGTVMVRTDSGNYEVAGGIIIYNFPQVYEETVVVPKTGLSSTLTYLFGSLTLVSGAWILIKNGKFN